MYNDADLFSRANPIVCAACGCGSAAFAEQVFDPGKSVYSWFGMCREVSPNASGHRCFSFRSSLGKCLFMKDFSFLLLLFEN
jgi:hypothetical protein